MRTHSALLDARQDAEVLRRAVEVLRARGEHDLADGLLGVAARLLERGG